VAFRKKMELDRIKIKQDLVKEGDILDSQGRYEEAIDSYDKVLQIDPDDADAWFNKGITLKKMGKHSEGTTCIETAINLYIGR
jgi:tetratricopeptide (TPR) repeat protein